jgi:outer membrane receptor for ferrienterochelin and colicins
MVCLNSNSLRTDRNRQRPRFSLYGSEAGGLINIITKNPKNARFFLDAFANRLGEVNVDIGFKANIGNAAAVLTELTISLQ